MRDVDELEAEPRRLGDSGAAPAAQMVRAVRRVGASAAAKRSLHRRARVFALVSAGSSFAAAAAAFPFGGAKAVAAIVAVSFAGGIGVGVYGLSSEDASLTVLPPSAAQPPPASATPTVSPADAPFGLPNQPPRPEDVAEPTLAQSEPLRTAKNVPARPNVLPTTAKPQRAAKARPQAEPSKPELGQEIALVDGMRRAVRSGQGALALQKIRDYRTRFPQGRFQLESRALEIEALAASGKSGRARLLADRFIRRHNNSLLADRVRPHATQ